MPIPADERLQARSDLAWAIAVGGIAHRAVRGADRVHLGLCGGDVPDVRRHPARRHAERHDQPARPLVKLPHPLRLVIVCLILAGLLAGVVYPRRRHHRRSGQGAEQHHQVAARQRQSLPRPARHRHQLFRARQRGHDRRRTTPGRAAPRPALPRNLPSAGELASSGGAIVSQTLKLLLGTVSAVGNFFIVLFLGLAFAAQPSIYHDGLIFMAPAKYRDQATVIVDRIGDTLERWLIAQIITMFAVFASTWIGLAIIGIQSSFILGIQAGLLAFIPTRRRHHRRADRGAGEPCLGLGRGGSASVLFLGVHAMESYVVTPMRAAPGARHPAGDPVRLPDPARHRVRALGPRAGAAADGDRQGHDRLFQADRTEVLRPRSDRFARSYSAEVSTVSVCSTSGGAAKYCPTRPRHSAKFSEPRKSTVWFSSVCPFHHQPVALRLLDRAVQLEAVESLGAAEGGARLRDRGLEILLRARLDVDLCDFGDHGPLCLRLSGRI